MSPSNQAEDTSTQPTNSLAGLALPSTNIRNINDPPSSTSPVQHGSPTSVTNGLFDDTDSQNDGLSQRNQAREGSNGETSDNDTAGLFASLLELPIAPSPVPDPKQLNPTVPPGLRVTTTTPIEAQQQMAQKKIVFARQQLEQGQNSQHRQLQQRQVQLLVDQLQGLSQDPTAASDFRESASSRATAQTHLTVPHHTPGAIPLAEYQRRFRLMEMRVQQIRHELDSNPQLSADQRSNLTAEETTLKRHQAVGGEVLNRNEIVTRARLSDVSLRVQGHHPLTTPQHHQVFTEGSNLKLEGGLAGDGNRFSDLLTQSLPAPTMDVTDSGLSPTAQNHRLQLQRQQEQEKIHFLQQQAALQQLLELDPHAQLHSDNAQPAIPTQHPSELTSPFPVATSPNVSVQLDKSATSTHAASSQPPAVAPTTNSLQKQRVVNIGLPAFGMTLPPTSSALDTKTDLESTVEFQDPSSLSGKRKVKELIATANAKDGLDPHVEDILLEVADEFIDSVCRFSCRLAKHRKSSILDTKDLQLHLERNWNIRIPGFASDEIRYHRKQASGRPSYVQRWSAVRKAQADRQIQMEQSAAASN